MKSLAAAIQFLTLCPWISRIHCDVEDLRRSLAWFPIVGLALGMGVALCDAALGRFLAPGPAGVVTVILMLGVSGGLHLDGLADTADGMLSARPRERALEIMKDSRIGAMGVIAIVSVFALKASALASVPDGMRMQTLALMPLAGRCALIFAMAAAPYARPEGGLATAFGRPRRWVVVFAFLVLLLVGGLALGIAGIAAAGFALLLVGGLSIGCRRRIGGFTGDTLGAACEIAELAPALVVSSWRFLS